MSELAAAYWRHAKGYYKNPANVKSALRPLRRLYGPTPAAEFGPKALRAVLGQMVWEESWSRSFANSMLGTIKRVFRFGVAEELVPVTVYQALLAVDGLKKGKTAAREPDAVGPVAEADVQATLPHLPVVVADMVRLQRLLGGRPGELVQMRPADIDMSGEIWFYSPRAHKTAHHGKPRRIPIGPRAQAILRPYLLRAADSHCFRPADSERKRHDEQRDRRRTRVQPSQATRRPKPGPNVRRERLIASAPIAKRSNVRPTAPTLKRIESSSRLSLSGE